MSNPFTVVKQLESDLCDYTGAPYCVTTTSCTMALLLACYYLKVQEVEIPRYTYCSVPQAIRWAGGTVKFRDENWTGLYQLKPYPVWDSARWLSSGMYEPYKGQMVALSFHWSKTLGLQQGGALLLDDPDAADTLRRLRFDGRREGVRPKDDTFILGLHAYLSPEIAALGVMRLSLLPKINMPIPWDDYADLSLTDWNSMR